MVKDIEELAPQLQGELFRKRKILTETHIRVISARPEENTASRRAEIPRSRRGEAGGIEIDESVRSELAAKVAILSTAQAISANR